MARALALSEAQEWDQLRAHVADWSAPDLADLIEEAREVDPVSLLRALPPGIAPAVFARLDHSHQERIVDDLSDDETRRILSDLPPDERTGVLAQLPADAARRILALLSPEDRKEASELLAYAPESVGRLMTPDYVALRPDWTLAQALAFVRRHGNDSETISRVYVVDAQGRLLDDLRLRQIILGAPERMVSALMDGDFEALSPDDPRERAAHEMQRHDAFALPVVDADGRMLGIVTADDALQVAQEEATRDIQMMGGQEALEAPYLETRFGTMMKKRGGWLALLFLGEMLTATAMAAFQDEIASAVVLALFIPLIISSGGNSGSQASTLVVRALALGQLRLRDWWRVIRREIATGLALGGLLAAIGVLRIVVWHGAFGSYGAQYAPIAVVVGLSLVCVVAWGAISGSTLPFLLRRMGFDPAAASAPFVATLVDVSGLVIYFSIAKVVLSGHLV